MTNEEAIKILNEIKYQFELSLSEAELEEEFALEAREDNDSAVKSLDLAIQALEKQIPKESIKHTKLPNGRFTYLCPTCNRLYWDKEFLSDYCCSCGQKLD